MSRHLIIGGGVALFAGQGMAFSTSRVPANPAPSIQLPPAFTLPPGILNMKVSEPKVTAVAAVGGAPGKGQKSNNNNNAGVEACRAANALANHCASAIPGIKDAPTEEIGKCFCCDGADFDPDYFDGIAASCADYLSEERPDATDEYKAWSTLGTLCGGGGMESVCTWTKQPPAPKTTSPPKAGGGGDTGWSLAGDSCKELHDLGAYCFQETRSFEQLPLSSQAECLCYMSDRTTSSWMPGLWDDAFAGCNGPKATVVITDTASAPEYDGLCSRFGDFLAKTASARPTITATTTTDEDENTPTTSSSPSSSPSSTTTSTSGSSSSSSEASPSSDEAADSETAAPAPTTSAAQTSETAAAGSEEGETSTETDTDTSAAAGLGLPATWPVAIGALLGAGILLL